MLFEYIAFPNEPRCTTSLRPLKNILIYFQKKIPAPHSPPPTPFPIELIFLKKNPFFLSQKKFN
jgi:hypothetical protein